MQIRRSVGYGGRAIATGEAGLLQGGDRLPYAEVNFSPLESMDRQLHVYGRSVYIIEAIASKPSGGAAYFRWKEDNRPAI
ncbi:hypothetical protein [Paenibacillus chitinolyticus]|uniref:hypothetical protein n=1 Tax=Paenibacillus chitinolyticus TaxID=79263 RepID=UPI00295E4777|nr:hypothetical protein [Paenibacillus chitinolyticus]